MAARLHDRLPEDTSAFVYDDLIAFAPTVSEPSLRAALAKAAKLARHRADPAIDALIFNGEWEESLWFRPLVRVGEDELAPVLPPLISPNTSWLAEHWLQEGGLDLERRGALFEAYLRDEVERAIAEGPLTDAECYSGPLTLHADDGTSEEIDLLVRVNGHVLVGEAKCRLFPSDDSNGWTHLISSVRAGSEQAARKASFVSSHRECLLRETGWDPDTLPDPLITIPAVVMSLPDTVGTQETEVPAVDEPILTQFFRTDRLRTHVKVQQGKVLDEGDPILFYDDPERAGEALESYLRNPPQIAVYEPYLITQTRFLPTTEGTPPIMHLHPEVKRGSVSSRARLSAS